MQEKDVPITKAELDRLNAGETVSIMLDDGTDLKLHKDVDENGEWN